MSIATLISRLRQLGIRVRLIEDNLKLDAPKGTLTPQLLEQLKEQKAEIIDFLKTNTAKKVKYTSLEPTEEKEYYPLSSAQKRMYIHQQMDEKSISYNMPYLFVLPEDISIEKLSHTFQSIIQRHQSLRTSFKEVNHKPVQVIHPSVPFGLVRFEAQSTEAARKIIKDFMKPFDLSTAPLLRAGLLHITGNDNRLLLVLDMHHIITDGVSQGILVDDLMALYEDIKLPPLNLQYKDYSQWQNSSTGREVSKKQEAYWLKTFSGILPVLNLPYDFPRPAVQSFEGATQRFHLDATQTQAINQISQETGATLFAILLTLLNILLAKLSGQEDIIVGVPVAAREHEDLQNIIGMFVNTLPMRNYPDGQKSFKEFLTHVKNRSLEAFENQQYQLEDLVDKVNIKRDAGRNPLFDVALSFPNMGTKKKDPPPTETKENPTDNYKAENRTSKMDLAFIAMETGSQINISCEYCRKLFTAETIQLFILYFKKIVTSALQSPLSPISQIEIITPEQKQQILFDFNETCDFPGDEVVHHLFEEQVDKYPQNIAVVAADGIESITYKELEERGNQLAHYLRSRGVGPDIIVGIMLERSIPLIVAMMGILKAGGAYMPIDSEYPQSRIQYMIHDSQLDLLIAESHTQIPEGDFEIISPLQGENENFPTTRLDKIVTPHHLLWVIYTSGSTGRPKGVMVEHKGFINFIYTFKQYFIYENHQSRMSQVAGAGFDGMSAEVWPALVLGAALYIADYETCIDVAKMKEWLIRNKITLAYQSTAVAEQLLAEEWPQSDVALREVYTAGDRLSRFPTRLFPFRFYNLYGPTEDTVWISGSEVPVTPNPPPGQMPNIGHPIPNHRVFIIDKYFNIQPIGVPGEICTSGIGLARGYLNQPFLTQEKFTVIQLPPPLGETRLYRTGDLGSWRPDGKLNFLGRVDHQVKIRGFRIEPGEIKIQLLKIDAIKEAAVIALSSTVGIETPNNSDESKTKYLCAYYVAHHPISAEDIKKSLTGHLPPYMIPSFFIPMDTLPLTPNGKLDRNALPLPQIDGNETFTPPATPTEETLVRIWADVLKIDHQKISTTANFFDIGGHSLKATQLTTGIHKALNIKFPLAQVFSSPTIKDMAQIVTDMSTDIFTALVPVERKDYYPLSSSQKRLFVLQQMENHNTSYNMPITFTLSQDTETARLEAVFNMLLQRHESLRTSFHMIDGTPMQKVHQDVSFSLEYICGDVAVIIPTLTRPFDLSQAPLIRVALVTRPANHKRVLFIDMHHIITDGISQNILQKEFEALYSGENLPSLPLQYKDYSHWQQEQLATGELKKQEEYWMAQLSEEIIPITLPLDFPRPPLRSFEGGLIHSTLSSTQSQSLKELARTQGTTVFMTLLAIFNIFLAKICRRDDIITGTPVAGRRHADLSNIIGMFVNTLILRLQPRGKKTFQQFLEEVKTKTLANFENQDYPFENLVNKLVQDRDTSRNPLFDVMFVYRNISDPTPELSAEGIAHESDTPKNNKHSARFLEHTTAKFDLTFSAGESKGHFAISFEYGSKLFLPETVQAFFQYIKQITQTILQTPAIPIAQIEIISEDQKQQVLHQFNQTDQYPQDKTVHHLFEDMVDKYPQNIAVVDSDGIQSITYQSLDHRANQLAHHLRSRGVHRDILVGVMLNRSISMVIAILGTLKAGGAYLPIDTAYPSSRVQYMLSDSNVRFLLTDRESPLPVNKLQLIAPTAGETLNCPQSRPIAEAAPNDLLYVIYTSGSTGRPKGVLIEHSGFVNFLTNHRKRFGGHHESRMTQVASAGFDAMALEIWPTLTNGATLYIADDETRTNTVKMKEWLIRNQITLSFQSTALSEQLLKEEWPMDVALKVLCTGGDKLTQFLSRNYPFTLHNLYGPTETTVWATSSAVAVNPSPLIGQFPDIGTPIDNLRLFIVDQHFKLQPIGIPGEICIAGIGLARGYLNHPQLTAERFFTPQFPTPLPQTRMYRTGDLAAWLPDGKISFLGRIDQQIKIRGYRIELGEIEHKLTEYPEINETVVTVFQSQTGEKQLCAYFTAAKAIEVSNLHDFLSPHLPLYMIPTCFQQIEAIPLTPNGKVNRKALPAPQIDTNGNYTAPRNIIEERLVEIWNRILFENIDTMNSTDSQNRIGIHHNFFRLGGHSLKATRVNALIAKTFNVKLPLAQLFQFPTIAQLSSVIADAETNAYQDLVTSEKKEYYPLSYNQRRLWIVHQFEPENASYNMFDRFRIRGTIDQTAIENILNTMVKRHESFRTCFKTVNNEPVQIILNNVPLPIQRIDISHLPETQREVQLEQCFKEEIKKPFKLDEFPLFRLLLVRTRTAPDDFTVFITMHHITSDGWSMGILRKEFAQLYDRLRAGQSPILPPLSFQYKDFAQWQNLQLNTPHIKERAHQFWRRVLEKELPVVSLPLDAFQEENINLGGAYISYLSNTLKERLDTLSQAHNTSMFIILVALFNILLGRVSGQKDILMGLAASGREHDSLEHIVGFFVNTIILDTHIDAEVTFDQFLSLVNNHAMNVLQHQSYPLELAADDLKIKFPQINVFFNMLNLGENNESLKSTEPFHTDDTVAPKFDLMVYASPYLDGISLNCTYKKALFRPTTIVSLMKKYTDIIDFFTTQPGKPILEYETTTKKKKKKRSLKRN